MRWKYERKASNSYKRREAVEASGNFLPGQDETALGISSSLHTVLHSSSPIESSSMSDWNHLAEGTSAKSIRESRLSTSLLQAAVIAVLSFVFFLSGGRTPVVATQEKAAYAV